MESKSKYFIAVYTNQVKDYCDKQFFANLGSIKIDPVHIIDNSSGTEYYEKLKRLAPWGIIRHLDIPEYPQISRFQRNVSESVNELRDTFLKTDKPYFLIIESDVLPPKSLLKMFDESIKNLPDDWGIIGGLYYDGFHNFNLEGLNETTHVLSGCTVYKREVIEKFPFRYDETSLGAFPDAWMSIDAGKDFTLWNDHNIICKHLHTKHGTRASRSL